MTEEVVAERDFRTADDRTITVRILKPAPRETGEWGCEVVFAGALDRRTTAYGVDSVQALFLALRLAGADLYTREPPVYWLDPDDDLGLPVPESIKDLRLARVREAP
jgi:hypothetical protein